MTVLTRGLVVTGLTVLLCSCALLPTGSKKRAGKTYLIAPSVAAAQAGDAGRCGVIQVGIGPVSSGQRGTHMNYTLEPHTMDYYAFARWAAPPARMLQQQLRDALNASGAFTGVLSSPASAESNYQLELADVSVLQRFDDETSSVLEMMFEVRLYDGDRRHLLGAQTLAATTNAGTDAASGVEAANRAAADLLADALDFTLTRCGAQ